MTRVVLTGASGFVGSHVLRHLLTETDWEIICPVTFRHRGIPDRISYTTRDIPGWQDRVTVDLVDLRAPVSPVTVERWGVVDYVLNVASESHVDRSIDEPGDFITNNVNLIVNLLDYCRVAKPKMLLQMSTDEVYGPADTGYGHREWDPIKPSNPYSASKAAQEAVCFSYWRTYDVPVVITNTMNIIGEMQDREKFVPKTMRSLLKGEPCTVHVSPDGFPGSRFYLHARNLADAWLWMIRNVKPQMYGDAWEVPVRYNIVGEREVSNVEMVELLAGLLGVNPKMNKVDFHSSRPGHDLRYALDGSALAKAGWRAPVRFEESLRRTVDWTRLHSEWLA